MPTDRRPAPATVAIASLLAALVPATAATGQSVDLVVDVLPPPADVAPAGDVGVRALVAGDTAPTDVRLEVDDVEVPATVAPAGGAWAVTGEAAGLAAGLHTATVDATVGGATTTRTWSFATTDVVLDRLAGDDRYATAVALSRDAFPSTGSAQAAVLARGDAFADALAGGPLAASVDGPLLLTGTDALPRATADELDRVLTEGAVVHVLGGTAAVGREVVAALEEAGHEVARHGGGDRYATAAAVADLLPDPDRVWVASGVDAPDALAASVPAARATEPILLTGPDRLATATAQAVASLAPARAVVVGGARAVGSDAVAGLEDAGVAVTRTAGVDRFATAAAVAERWVDGADAVTLVDAYDFPDALTGGAWAARDGAPLLLAGAASLGATDGALRSLRPGRVTVVGGGRAVGDVVASAARNAVHDGPDAPRLLDLDPPAGGTSTLLAPITLDLDRPLVADGLAASVTVEGTELPSTAALAADGRGVVVDLLTPGENPDPTPREVVVRVRATSTAGTTGHVETGFTFAPDDRVYASWGGLDLVEPSTAVEVVGYHQSNHEGARDQVPDADGPPWTLLGSRGRASGRYSAADVVTPTDVPITAPVTGTVVRAGSYVLYCDLTDVFVAIEPDGFPGFELKILHFTGLQVTPGDRVVAGETVVGAGARQLPFTSQVDEFSSSGRGPHVHVELVDTSIPNVPNGGSGSDGC